MLQLSGKWCCHLWFWWYSLKWSPPSSSGHILLFPWLLFSFYFYYRCANFEFQKSIAQPHGPREPFSKNNTYRVPNPLVVQVMNCAPFHALGIDTFEWDCSWSKTVLGVSHPLFRFFFAFHRWETCATKWVNVSFLPRVQWNWGVVYSMFRYYVSTNFREICQPFIVVLFWVSIYIIYVSV